MANQFVRDVPFKNWTNFDFIHKFGGEEYTFEKGGTYNVPGDIAIFFAKHLAIEALHRQADEAKKLYTNEDDKVRAAAKFESLPDNLMREYQERCFPSKDKKAAVGNSFERVDVSDGEAKASVPVKENKTVASVQNDTSKDDDADASDEKNNAGAPLIKGMGKVGRPRKDAEYVK